MNGGVGKVVSTVPPGAGAAVMGTAILSVGTGLVPIMWLSYVLLVVAALLWVALAAVFLTRLAGDRTRWRSDADVPASLTGVAGTCVLGTRLSLFGWQPLAGALLALAFVLWLVLLPMVLRHWVTPTVGASFLVCVATQGLAVLGATVAAATGYAWLAVAAGIAFLLGLVAYVGVVATFDVRQVARGRGDHWVAGGAVAISALACGKLVGVADLFGMARGPVQVAALVLWGVAVLWYLVLAVAELRWPRFAYDVRRWSTVFPLGMTAVASLVIGTATHHRVVHVVGLVLIWPALVVWALTAVGAARHMRATAVGAGERA